MRKQSMRFRADKRRSAAFQDREILSNPGAMSRLLPPGKTHKKTVAHQNSYSMTNRNERKIQPVMNMAKQISGLPSPNRRQTGELRRNPDVTKSNPEEKLNVEEVAKVSRSESSIHIYSSSSESNGTESEETASSSESGIGSDNNNNNAASHRDLISVRTPRSRQQWNTEVAQFQQAKKQSLIDTNYESWRAELRGTVMAELEQRVREAVKTPPRERHQRRRTLKRDFDEAQRLVEQRKSMERIVQMNELAGGARAIDIRDTPPKSTLFNTIDLRMHPETIQLRKQWYKGPLSLRREKMSFIHLPQSEESEDEKFARDKYHQSSSALDRWKRWLDAGRERATTLDMNLYLANEFTIQEARQETLFSELEPDEITAMASFERQQSMRPKRGYSLYENVKNRSALVKQPSGSYQSLTEHPKVCHANEINNCPCYFYDNQTGEYTNADRTRRLKMTRRGEQIGTVFSFDWDFLPEERDPGEQQARHLLDNVLSLTDEDREQLKSLRSVKVTPRNQRKWLTRQDVLQRLNQLSTAEKQMFYFCATRAAYLTATLNNQNMLPDGSVFQKIEPNEIIQLLTVSSAESTFIISEERAGPSSSVHAAGEMLKVAGAEMAPTTGRPPAAQPPVYVDWCGVVRDQHGPFWPPGVGPLYPPPKHLRSDEDSYSSTRRKINQDPQNSLLSISKRVSPMNVEGRARSDAVWPRARVVFDSECSPRWTAPMLEALIASSQLVTSVPKSAWIPPSLSFESRFESGNLRQARRVYSRNAATTTNRLLAPEINYYQLQWEMTFPHADDLCYLAYCYPYTHTDLKRDLKDVLQKARESQYPPGTVKCSVLCQTRAGNSAFLLTVTDPSEPINGKYAAVLTARVHPGESNSSWVMLGLVRFLTSNTAEAKELRKRFVFLLVPMLNPDGVIIGNYRCSLTGRDLNRNYRHPHKDAFPTAWHMRSLVQNYREICKDVIYCDLHGHSRRNDVFMYGCDPSYRASNKAETSMKGTFETSLHLLQERLLPYLLSKQVPKTFSLAGCRFSIHPAKESTSRVVFWREFQVTHSFTLEATFNGTALMRALSNSLNTIAREIMCRILSAYGDEVEEAINSPTSGFENTKEETVQKQTVIDPPAVLRKSVPVMKKWKRLKSSTSVEPTSRVQKFPSTDQLIAAIPSDTPLEELVEAVSWLEEIEAKSQLEKNNVHGSMTEQDESSSSDSNSDSEHELSVVKQKQLKSNHSRGFNILRTKLTNRRSTSRWQYQRPEDEQHVDSTKKTRRPKKRTRRVRSMPVSLLHGRKIVENHPRCNGKEDEQAGDKHHCLNECDRIPMGNVSKLESNNTLGDSMFQLETARDKLLRYAECKSHFVGKYSGQTNGGIPCFVEKRILERACRLKSNLVLECHGGDVVDRQFLHHLQRVMKEAQRHEDVLEVQASHYCYPSVTRLPTGLGVIRGGIPPLPAFMVGLNASRAKLLQTDKGSEKTVYLREPMPFMCPSSQSCSLYYRTAPVLPKMRIRSLGKSELGVEDTDDLQHSCSYNLPTNTRMNKPVLVGELRSRLHQLGQNKWAAGEKRSDTPVLSGKVGLTE
ncbi:unnamed protein product [Calicophoron daubneyi]|uniref:Peptidase M14 domain-containing protein n=1 Tax=Calicophoron daubneyi TaxID=300641 RepID=A0AAV2SZM4_CALDB